MRSGHPRRAVRPHMGSILTKLWRAHVERMLAQQRGLSTAPAEEKIRSLGVEAQIQGLSPIELRIKLKEMDEQTSTMFGLKSNPKYPVAENFADDARRYVERGIPFSISAERERRGFRIQATPSPWGGKLAIVIPNEKIFAVKASDFFALPTVVHALREIFTAVPEFDDYELKEHLGTRGSGHIETDPTGYTVNRFMSELKLVREESIVRSGRDETETEKTFEYWATESPQEMTWYHATLAKYVTSIRLRGLLPSSLDEERVEGWSPGWNMHLQGAVYLTSSEDYAREIAETLAVRSEEDAVVLQIDGAGLEDTKLLTFDEDALRNEIDGGVQLDDYDTDFPQWVTSQEHRIRSVAYKGRIPPRFISVLATGKLVVEAYARGYADPEGTPETHPEDYKFIGEVKWDDAEQ